MRKLNALVEQADYQTGYRFDRFSLPQLVEAICDWHPGLAYEIRKLALELGLWSHE